MTGPATTRPGTTGPATTGAGLLVAAVERIPLTGHDGRSGATLERVRPADSTRLVLQRSRPAGDLVALATGRADRELALSEAGVPDRLRPGVAHAIVAGWRDGTDVVMLMRDVAAHIPGRSRPLDRAECRRLLDAAGNAGQVRATREQIVTGYRAVTGDWQDEAGMALGFVTGLLHLGWNKALDAVEHPDPGKRALERADLGWWLQAAAPGLADLRR